MAKAINHFLAIYVGSDKLGWSEDPNAGRTESRMWDMLRYDRCHPLGNADRFAEMGFIVLIQPAVKDMRGGFTLDRWQSFGFRSALFEGKSESRSVPYEMEDMMISFAKRKEVTHGPGR